MAWITTNTSAGPLTTDNYYFTITGLSASTKYCYRAYFIVDGVEYYGNTYSGTTAASSLTVPTVTTGSRFHPPQTTGFIVSGNTITCKGNTSILEYGLLYTQQALYGTNTTLVYNNYPANVSKASSLSDIPSVPYTYITGTTGLAPSTLTYYRAFARNAKGVGYGAINTQVTATPAPTDISFDVSVSWNCAHSGNLDGIGGNVYLKCCTDFIVETCNITDYSKFVDTFWTVPAGCYYVDFSGLCAKKNGLAIPWGIMWTDNNHYTDYTPYTNCYSSSTSITAQIPLEPL